MIVAPFGGRGAPPVRFHIAQRAHGFEMCVLARTVKGPPRCSATGAMIRSNIEMLPFAPERAIDCRDRDRAQGIPVQAPDSGFWLPGRQAVAQTGRRRCPHVARTLPAHRPHGVPTLPATTKQASSRDSSTCRWGSKDRHSRKYSTHGVFFCFSQSGRASLSKSVQVCPSVSKSLSVCPSLS